MTRPGDRQIYCFTAFQYNGVMSAEHFHGYLSMQSRGLIAMPASLRKRYGLDEPGAQLEVTEREDGVIELRPMLAVPATERWFWTDEWQAGEQEVDAHVRSGDLTVTKDADEFLGSLPGGSV